MKIITDKTEFNPDWMSPPGDTIIDILNERNISLHDFSTRINMCLRHTLELLEGDRFITLKLARKLVNILGASIEFWMLRDYQYYLMKENVFNQNIIHEPYQTRMKL